MGEESMVQFPYEESMVQSPYEESTVQSPYEESTVQSPYEESMVQTPVEDLLQESSEEEKKEAVKTLYQCIRNAKREYGNAIFLYDDCYACMWKVSVYTP